MEIAQVEKLIGSCVERVESSDSGALTLHFANTGKALSMRTPWTFTSCLESVSSGVHRAQHGDTSDLTGLDGAQLTGFESDQDHIDLHFGSITISAPK